VIFGEAMNKAICQIVLDASGHNAQGINTYDPDHAARWAREVCRNVKMSGFMKRPFVTQFAPAHHGWPDNAAVRVLRRLGASCILRNDGIIEVSNASDCARAAAVRLGLDIVTSEQSKLELRAPDGDTHGLAILKSIHRVHADVVHKEDGSIELRNLHHYPERESDDLSGISAAHPFLTKKQWVKIPSAVSKRHCVIIQPEKTA
jgi:hypothetical protein